jgi:hypothetical protein
MGEGLGGRPTSVQDIGLAVSNGQYSSAALVPFRLNDADRSLKRILEPRLRAVIARVGGWTDAKSGYMV